VVAWRGDAQEDDNGNEVTFFDLCFRPLPLYNDNRDCVIQSVAGYWQNRIETLEANRCNRLEDPGVCPFPDDDLVIQHYVDCTANPTYTGTVTYPLSCLPPFQDPIKPEVVVGGCVPTQRARESQGVREERGRALIHIHTCPSV
jgi:hypothetical protein